MSRIEIATPTGPAWADLDQPSRPIGLLMLGHGASGGVDAPDLRAARDAAVGVGVTVARISQPHVVAGRRSPAPAARLDEAWLAVAHALAARRGLRGLPLIVGGRSAGARVACRTAADTGAVAVIALAFPVHPPGKPERSRLDELALPRLPVLVVQGDRDAFGMPPPDPARRLVVIPGADHSLRKDLPAVAAAVAEFLAEHLGEGR